MSSFLNKLIPEVRLKIYEELLTFKGLYSHDGHGNPKLADLSVLRVNKLIHKEAIEVFYSQSVFRLSDEYIIKQTPLLEECQCGFKYAGNGSLGLHMTMAQLQAKGMRRLAVSLDSQPDHHHQIWTIQHSKFSICTLKERKVSVEHLIPFLCGMPRLKLLSLDCEDIHSFRFGAELFRDILTKSPNTMELKVRAIGIVELIDHTNTPDTKQMKLYFRYFRDAWSNPEESLNEYASHKLISLLCYKMKALKATAMNGRIPRLLLHFFEKQSPESNALELKLKNHPGGAKRLLAFTIALVTYFMEGSVYDDVGPVKWDLSEGCYEQEPY